MWIIWESTTIKMRSRHGELFVVELLSHYNLNLEGSIPSLATKVTTVAKMIAVF